MVNPVVWVADVGSVAKNRFGWCRAPSRQERDWSVGPRIDAFAQGIADDLSRGDKVALGFECPLFVPVAKADQPEELTSAREGDDGRAWSAAWGTTVLAVGLAECVWVFERIRELARQPVQCTFDWDEFTSGEANLFIWEAFVSKGKKGASHVDDARIAAREFWSNHPRISEANAVNAHDPYSLAGAGLLRSGLTRDLRVLFRPCIVIKP